MERFGSFVGCMKKRRGVQACGVKVGKHLTHREKCQMYRAHTHIQSCLQVIHALLHPHYT